jgi:hypothetical protein
MKVVVAVVLVAACSGKSPPTQDTTHDASSDSPPIGPCVAPEALPPPHCGTGAGCSCCASCSISGELCFGAVTSVAVGIGQCVASPVPGSVDMTAGAATFSATRTAAAVVDAYVEVSAQTDTQTLVLAVPGAPGTYSCSDPGSPIEIAFFSTASYANRPSNGARPACTVTVTSVGAVGERIEGTFSATVTSGTTMLDLTNGVFSVERVAYP